MAVEGAICSFSVEGLETFTLVALSVLAVGMFSVFGGKFFKKSENYEELEVPSLAWTFFNFNFAKSLKNMKNVF